MPQLISTRELWQVFWLETYCIPQKTIYERYVFRTKAQEDSTVDLFVTDVKRRAEYCEFGTLKDPKLRKRLLRETDLSLKKAIKLCQIEEQSKVFDSPTARANRVRFFFWRGGGESKNRFVISDHIDSSLSKKTEDPKKDYLPLQRRICPRAPREGENRGKKQQADPRGEHNKEKQHKLRMNIWNVYISVWNTNVSRIEYTP